MAIELIGAKTLVCQIVVKLGPSVDGKMACQEFLNRLQIPAGFIGGAQVTVGLADPVAAPPNGRPLGS